MTSPRRDPYNTGTARLYAVQLVEIPGFLAHFSHLATGHRIVSNRRVINVAWFYNKHRYLTAACIRLANFAEHFVGTENQRRVIPATSTIV